ncbi:MAG TPA: hypothetical protein VFV64_10800, partial [Permianibacter sp.]|nr:hypothetical protein [Permianibacter sp.]
MTDARAPQRDARIADHFVDAWGQARPVADSTLDALARALASVQPAAASPVRVHRVSQGALELRVPGVLRWSLQ